MWLHTKKGVYSVKSGYHVARQLQKMESWAETSAGPIGVQVWSKLWKLNVPKKIKVLRWRACQNILPTRANLRQQKVIDDDASFVQERLKQGFIHCRIVPLRWMSRRVAWFGCRNEARVNRMSFNYFMSY